ncbi:hypothetical protein FGM00_07075 [Aggregatimonas sangjinii]|uniref:DUF6630 domain-containing protein n=1 Tax=Aggregatimonas sangjinii TaxID=2583587 RepID=A0A5B7SNY7_9FLAO|nr:DUF6630 family protein [Aggregatimonas sangjinii]QCW99871.1 hypothetical protein FGM00_07075 [Aggregatimonas sangjinii]
MGRIEPLLELAKLISEDDSFVSEVQLAENQPFNYLGQFERALQERGIHSAIPSLPWIAFVDGLARRDQLVELDWKDDPQELIATTMKLLKNHPEHEGLAEPIKKIEPFIDEDIEEFLPQLNAALKEFDVQLVWIDIDSDSYPLTILPSKNVDEAERLASEADYGSLKL